MRTLLSFAFFLSVSVLLLAACNSDDSHARSGSVPANLSTATPSDGVRRITVTELKEAVDKNAVLIVDTRVADAYSSEHIKGSINIIEGNLDAHLSELPRDKMIVAYCS